ncbi:hypothetical protein GII33_07775 [Gordonia pseudamarae]|uniref:ABC transporter substrate-binding protein n=1 Tax=Gordonia pseudamarae TaxID=2831662 RepID=A0ABX6INS5_9ACTN|nr:hypothetical protein [Gordonia sp. (in: high G+C Gram-positive bacteria)]QHN28557.1 hypothetical protein GII33_07775 [Gordonia pseudamarae]QHN37425.1 hypothetical protein GII31_07745 [Gordonia pseudamarae]
MGPVSRRVWTVLCLIVVVASMVTACDDPGRAPHHRLVVGATDTPMMRVVANIYTGALRRGGADVSETVTIGDDARLLEKMSAAEVDLFGAFTGTLLTSLAPQATSMTAEDVFVELNHSLPQGVSVGDPTLVVTGEPAPRAQVLVPVYRSAALSRKDMKTVNKVAGELTTADLEALADRAAQGGEPGDLAAAWLTEHGL